jgi:hypothetical protein
MPVPGMEGLYAGSEIAGIHRTNTASNVDTDVFPPIRSQAANNSTFLAYIPEDIAFEEEYKDFLSDLGMSEDFSSRRDGGLASFPGSTAWAKLERLPNLADNISDSESVISIGDLGEETRFEDKEARDENRNDWEVCSYFSLSFPTLIGGSST